jgi:hypothetical protein
MAPARLPISGLPLPWTQIPLALALASRLLLSAYNDGVISVDVVTKRPQNVALRTPGAGCWPWHVAHVGELVI